MVVPVPELCADLATVASLPSKHSQGSGLCVCVEKGLVTDTLFACIAHFAPKEHLFCTYFNMQGSNYLGKWQDF